MIYSMTGYAVASADSPRGALALELRSVNSRYLEIQFRVAEEMRATEPMLRELITARIARGKVDCRLNCGSSATPAPRSLNLQALGQLRALASEAAGAFPEAAPLRIADVLRWPGVLAEPAADEERTRGSLEALCRRALDELCAARGREGAKLAAILLGRVAEMRRRLTEVAPLVPEAVAVYRARLAERLREVLEAGGEERIRAEVSLFAAKSDVDEELTRLAAHLDEVERVLAKGGAAGKRLDFLAQELNREANTLAAKAAGLKISDCALELKLLIEQVREQVQNIE
ncbi:MAG TPA: YicC/YloC family endoribonuclease [Burkholderiales bacterium]|nr:YicC/YloC family endoribonuclease [Burkholderiales bacterium]